MAVSAARFSLRMESRAASGKIRAVLDPPRRNPPGKIYLRFRHPQGKPMRGVTVNGKAHADFDPLREWVVLPGQPQEGSSDGRVIVEATY